MTLRPAAHPRLILAALAFCGVLVSISQTIVVPLLPELPRITNSSAADVSWLITVTLLTGAVFTPLLGRAGDMYGKRRVLLIALASMVIGSLLCASSNDLPVLIAGRAFQGAAIAVVPLGISILRDELPPRRVIPSIAIMSSTLGVGAAFGIPAATLVVQYANWHTMFWINLGLGLLDIALVLLIVPESAVRTSGRFDVIGAIGLSAFLVCLLLAVSKGQQLGYGGDRRAVRRCRGHRPVVGLVRAADHQPARRSAGVGASRRPVHQPGRAADRVLVLRQLAVDRAVGAGAEVDRVRAG